MLFDLRSRGRRRTVQVIYLGLAFLMLGGLVLFGVGAGNGFGGLLNAFTNNGSGNSQNSAVSSQTKAALKATQKNPSSAAAWADLVQAEWTAAGEGSNYDSTTDTYTASGKKELAKTEAAFQTYTTLTKNPALDISTLAAEAYELTAQYAKAADAWQYVINSAPSAIKGYECLAFSALAAKNTRVGGLAEAQTLKLAPKIDRIELKQEFTEAKTTPALAQEACG